MARATLRISPAVSSISCRMRRIASSVRRSEAIGCWSANSWYTCCSIVQHQALDLAVGRVDLVDEREVGVEQRLGRGADLLAALGRELHDLGADLLLLLVERSPGLDHGVLRSLASGPVCGRVCVRAGPAGSLPAACTGGAPPRRVHLSFTRGSPRTLRTGLAGPPTIPRASRRLGRVDGSARADGRRVHRRIR